MNSVYLEQQQGNTETKSPIMELVNGQARIIAGLETNIEGLFQRLSIATIPDVGPSSPQDRPKDEPSSALYEIILSNTRKIAQITESLQNFAKRLQL